MLLLGQRIKYLPFLTSGVAVTITNIEERGVHHTGIKILIDSQGSGGMLARKDSEYIPIKKRPLNIHEEEEHANLILAK